MLVHDLRRLLVLCAILQGIFANGFAQDRSIGWPTKNSRRTSCPTCPKDCPDVLSSPWYGKQVLEETLLLGNHRNQKPKSYEFGKQGEQFANLPLTTPCSHEESSQPVYKSIKPASIQQIVYQSAYEIGRNPEAVRVQHYNNHETNKENPVRYSESYTSMRKSPETEDQRYSSQALQIKPSPIRVLQAECKDSHTMPTLTESKEYEQRTEPGKSTQKLNGYADTPKEKDDEIVTIALTNEELLSLIAKGWTGGKEPEPKRNGYHSSDRSRSEFNYMSSEKPSVEEEDVNVFICDTDEGQVDDGDASYLAPPQSARRYNEMLKSSKPEPEEGRSTSHEAYSRRPTNFYEQWLSSRTSNTGNRKSSAYSGVSDHGNNRNINKSYRYESYARDEELQPANRKNPVSEDEKEYMGNRGYPSGDNSKNPISEGEKEYIGNRGYLSCDSRTNPISEDEKEYTGNRGYSSQNSRKNPVSEDEKKYTGNTGYSSGDNSKTPISEGEKEYIGNRGYLSCDSRTNPISEDEKEYIGNRGYSSQDSRKNPVSEDEKEYTGNRGYPLRDNSKNPVSEDEKKYVGNRGYSSQDSRKNPVSEDEKKYVGNRGYPSRDNSKNPISEDEKEYIGNRGYSSCDSKTNPISEDEKEYTGSRGYSSQDSRKNPVSEDEKIYIGNRGYPSRDNRKNPMSDDEKEYTGNKGYSSRDSYDFSDGSTKYAASRVRHEEIDDDKVSSPSCKNVCQKANPFNIKGFKEIEECFAPVIAETGNNGRYVQDKPVYRKMTNVRVWNEYIESLSPPKSSSIYELLDAQESRNNPNDNESRLDQQYSYDALTSEVPAAETGKQADSPDKTEPLAKITCDENANENSFYGSMPRKAPNNAYGEEIRYTNFPEIMVEIEKKTMPSYEESIRQNRQLQFSEGKKMKNSDDNDKRMFGVTAMNVKNVTGKDKDLNSNIPTFIEDLKDESTIDAGIFRELKNSQVPSNGNKLVEWNAGSLNEDRDEGMLLNFDPDLLDDIDEPMEPTEPTPYADYIETTTII